MTVEKICHLLRPHHLGPIDLQSPMRLDLARLAEEIDDSNSTICTAPLAKALLVKSNWRLIR